MLSGGSYQPLYDFRHAAPYFLLIAWGLLLFPLVRAWRSSRGEQDARESKAD